MAQQKILGNQIDQPTLDPNLFLPSQSGNNGSSLLTNGSTVYWGPPTSTSANLLDYVFNTSTTPTPAVGEIRYNNATQTSATQIFVNKTSNVGKDLTNFYRKVVPSTILSIQSKIDSTQYHRWFITNTLENIDNFTWTVTLLDSNGTFTNLQNVLTGYAFAGLPPQSLNDLSDVTLTTPLDNQLLTYDSGTLQWINKTPINVPTGGNANKVFFENQVTVTDSYTISTNYNAGTFGPITINNGVIITVPNGSIWSVV